MRIEELSIGDWVRHTFYEENVRIVRIYGDSERVLAEKGKLSISCHLNHFESIPLTPEILEKNGFRYPHKDKKSGNYTGTYFCNPVPSKNHYLGDFAEVWIHNDYCEANIFTTAKPKRAYPQCDYDFKLETYGYKYVHELQHYLRLMHIEKEIIL